jgi:hypothetical protein
MSKWSITLGGRDRRLGGVVSTYLWRSGEGGVFNRGWDVGWAVAG